jgi:asparagine N-glycosylation enzyme membrane subunit Stt3
MFSKLAPLLTVAILLLVAFLSFEARSTTWATNDTYQDSDTWHSLDSDGLYHMRRLSEYRKVDGLPSARDTFLNYPDGAIIPWPPYYTVVADVFVDDDDSTLEMQMGRLPWLFSALTSVLVALAALMIAGRGAALLAGLLHAFSYASIHYGGRGVADHHALVSMLNCFILVAFTFASKFGGFSSLRACMLSSLTAGAAAGLMLGVWVGALMYLVPIQLLCLWWLYNYFNRQVALFVSLFHLSALAVLMPAILQSPWIADYPWMVINLSNFHWLWLSLGVVLPIPIWWSCSQVATRKYMRLAVACGAAVTAIIFAFDIPPASHILEGFAWVSRADAFMAGIAESAPLIGDTGSQSTGLLEWIGWTALMLPFAYWWACRDKKFATPVLLPWLIALPPLLLQGLAQRRFADALSAPMAVIVAVGYVWLLSKTKMKPPVKIVFATLFLFFGQFPGITYSFTGKSMSPYNEVTGAEHDLFEWIAEQEPQPRSVLAAWDFGHTIEWVAKRPSIATNFGSYIGRDSFVDPAKFFMASSHQDAEDILLKRKVQYVVVTSQLPDLLASHAQRVGADVKEYRTIIAGKELQLSAKWFQTMAAQVFNLGYDITVVDGPAPSIPYLRLVYVSPVLTVVGEQLGSKTSVGRIWEYVPGADVHGVTQSNSAIDVVVDFKFMHDGKKLVANQWSAHVRSDDNGAFEVRVPYCSGSNGEAMVTKMTWSDSQGAHVFELSEAQVMNGETVRLK